MFGKKYLAVDIGNRNIKLVSGEANKDSFTIYEYDIINTPLNSIRDGKIINLSAIADAVNGSVSRFKMTGRQLILIITGTGVITRDIQIPRANDQEIEQMLEFEAQQYFPVDLENYVLDFKVLEDLVNDEGSFSRVLLVAVPSKQVEEYMKLPGLLKKELAAIDLPVNCLSKFLSVWNSSKTDKKQDMTDKEHEYAVLDIGSETTGVSIFSGNKLRFSRILLNGSADIDKTVANARDVDFYEAERIKLDVGALIADGEEKIGQEIDVNLDSALKSAVDNIIVDLNRFFEFYSSRNNANRLESIHLCGGGSKLKGLPEYLGNYFNIPVSHLDLKRKVTYKGKRRPDEFEKDYIFLINVIGALKR